MASALSSTALMASPRSTAEIARMASRSLSSSRPSRCPVSDVAVALVSVTALPLHTHNLNDVQKANYRWVAAAARQHRSQQRDHLREVTERRRPVPHCVEHRPVGHAEALAAG